MSLSTALYLVAGAFSAGFLLGVALMAAFSAAGSADRRSPP